MARHIFLAFTHPTPGREADFLEWQRGTHIPEGLSIPGFVGATFYRMGAEQLLDGLPPEPGAFVTVWEIESDDLAATKADVERELARFHWSDAIDGERTRCLTYTQEFPRREA